MFYNILDKPRLDILSSLKNFKEDFYLAGGTGLALQIGHRDSIDFDFFTEQNIDTPKLFNQIKKVFTGHKILKVQDEENTLTVFIDEKIKLSFFKYPYPLIGKLIKDDNLRIASIEDIACMKLSAIVSRATNKDYIDLYFIFKQLSIHNIFQKLEIKFKDLDVNLVLKSLVYFKDVKEEPIKFKNNHDIDFKKVCNFLVDEIKKF